MSDDNIELRAYGSLNLKATNPTLADLEAFCAEARRLGLGDNEPLRPFRQGLMGPVISWHFDVPVVPKKVEVED